MVKAFEHYKKLTSDGVDKWRNVTGNVNPEVYKKLLVEGTRSLYNLRDAYKGKDCLVMGLGPSLLEIDKDRYRDHIKLVCNRFYLVPDFFDDNFRPDFWCGCNDIEVLRDPIKLCIENEIKMFLTTPNSMQFEEILENLRKNEYLNNVFLWHWDSEILQKFIADKYDIINSFSRPVSIIIEMIAFAFWLGCNSITVTGMDLSYLESYKEYGMTHAGFDQSEELFNDHNVGGATALSNEHDRRKMIDNLEYFARISLKEGIKFYNTSHRQNKINIEGFEILD